MLADDLLLKIPCALSGVPIRNAVVSREGYICEASVVDFLKQEGVISAFEPFPIDQFLQSFLDFVHSRRTTVVTFHDLSRIYNSPTESSFPITGLLSPATGKTHSIAATVAPTSSSAYQRIPIDNALVIHPYHQRLCQYFNLNGKRRRKQCDLRELWGGVRQSKPVSTSTAVKPEKTHRDFSYSSMLISAASAVFSYQFLNNLLSFQRDEPLLNFQQNYLLYGGLYLSLVYFVHCAYHHGFQPIDNHLAVSRRHQSYRGVDTEEHFNPLSYAYKAIMGVDRVIYDEEISDFDELSFTDKYWLYLAGMLALYSTYVSTCWLTRDDPSLAMQIAQVGLIWKLFNANVYLFSTLGLSTRFSNWFVESLQHSTGVPTSTGEVINLNSLAQQSSGAVIMACAVYFTIFNGHPIAQSLPMPSLLIQLIANASLVQSIKATQASEKEQSAHDRYALARKNPHIKSSKRPLLGSPIRLIQCIAFFYILASNQDYISAFIYSVNTYALWELIDFAAHFSLANDKNDDEFHRPYDVVDLPEDFDNQYQQYLASVDEQQVRHQAT